MSYLCTVFRQEERPKESAFSPYSDRVNLDHLHYNCKLWNKGVTRCSLGLYYTLIHPLWSCSQYLYYSAYRESRPLHEKIETLMDGSTFFVVLFFTEP